jgi:hypothetical protein
MAWWVVLGIGLIVAVIVPQWLQSAQWVARRRTRIDQLVVFLGVASTALVGLLVEDLLPRVSENKKVDLDPHRIAMAAVAVLLLLAAVSLRDRVRRRFGTLYYLELLLGNQRSFHTTELAELEASYTEAKRLSQRALRASSMGFDLAPAVERLNAALDMQLESDTPRTAYHIAPNLILPAAIATGYGMSGRASMELVELGGALSWVLDRTAPPVSSDRLQRMDVQARPTGLRAIVVDISDAGQTSLPSNFELGLISQLQALDQEGRSCCVVLHNGNPRFGMTKAGDTALFIDPRAVLDFIVVEVLKILGDHSHQPTVLLGRTSKTMNLALGWRLASASRPFCGDVKCSDPDCMDPWRRLVILNAGRGASASTYALTRVSQAQPPIEELARRLHPESIPGLVNLTSHPITVFTDPPVHIPISGRVARLTEEIQQEMNLDLAAGVVLPRESVKYLAKVVDLPEPEPGVTYVVSRVLAAAVPRADLVFPSREVRDSNGAILGCRALGRFERDDSPGENPRAVPLPSRGTTQS